MNQCRLFSFMPLHLHWFPCLTFWITEIWAHIYVELKAQETVHSLNSGWCSSYSHWYLCLKYRIYLVRFIMLNNKSSVVSSKISDKIGRISPVIYFIILTSILFFEYSPFIGNYISTEGSWYQWEGAWPWPPGYNEKLWGSFCILLSPPTHWTSS